MSRRRQSPRIRKIFFGYPRHSIFNIMKIDSPSLRMLLFQRAVVEGSLSLCLQCGLYADRIRISSGEEKERSQLLLDILTPIAKSYPGEMGIASTSQAIQCLGGYGYCEDFPVEQYFRESRIHPIHEGTTGIQGKDLLGRKMVINKGRSRKGPWTPCPMKTC